MKYTRYDMKRKNKQSLLLGIVLFSTLIFAFIIGTLLSNLIIKNSNISEASVKPQESSANTSNTNKTENKSYKYIVVQHGLYSKPEYLEQGKKDMLQYGNPFTVQEEKGTRVLLGVFTEEEGTKVMKTLTDKGVENSKMLIEIKTENNPCNEEIAAIISAEVDILTKLSDSNVKSIQTSDLKTWCAALKDVDKNSKNIEILKELKNHVGSLQNELTRDKAADAYTYIYKVLKSVN